MRTAQGVPVRGAKVVAELRYGNRVQKLTGTTKEDGSVRFRTTVQQGNAEATLTVTDVHYQHLGYYGELDPVRTLELTRPTGHKG
ncbi:hypothetical protein [Streptomyces sp. NPDC048411]|uniref:hypothetical protein n=1 Tax=Streptomyces sp. NPDC048411 TaxID=3157206 RepID=UPI0034521B52